MGGTLGASDGGAGCVDACRFISFVVVLFMVSVKHNHFNKRGEEFRRGGDQSSVGFGFGQLNAS